MMEAGAVKTLCEESNRIAQEHGWNDEHRPFGTIVSLFHSELSEALEEYRAGKGLHEVYWEVKDCNGNVGVIDDPNIKEVLGGKPAGIPIELADFLIRIAHEVDLHEFTGRFVQQVACGFGDDHRVSQGRLAEELLPRCHAIISRAYTWNPDTMTMWAVTELASAFCLVMQFCINEGIDIERALEMKARYNESRPYRHGGKRV